MIIMGEKITKFVAFYVCTGIYSIKITFCNTINFIIATLNQRVVLAFYLAFSSNYRRKDSVVNKHSVYCSFFVRDQ